MRPLRDLPADQAFDYLIVGAGFAGATLARLLAEHHKTILVIDRRKHIAGNAYDHIDPTTGIRVHQYGPHLFHTSSERVWSFLSRFTKWDSYEHRVLSKVDNEYYPIPINIDTVNRLYKTDYDETTIEDFFKSVREVREIKNSEDVSISKVGRDLYEKFFKNYTHKQWGLEPLELDASVMARIPVRTNHDDRYFTDSHQAIPREGYTAMFDRMLTHDNITVCLNQEYKTVRGQIQFRELIYTGCIDEFFDYRFGKLAYRSLRFEWERHDQAYHQPVLQVNFPNDHAFTRQAEYKHLPGSSKSDQTIVCNEYPCAEGDPYYPIPRAQNEALYQKYRQAADQLTNVHFIGRLAQYRYYNMDKVVESAMEYFNQHLV